MRAPFIRSLPRCLRRRAVLGGLALASLAQGAEMPGPTLTLWYPRPAMEWVEALPVGNGRLGAMIYGGIQHERLQLNEDTLWAGGPYEPINPQARASLPRIRELLAAGEHAAAQQLVQEQFMAEPMKQMPYQTLGALQLTTAGSEYAADYRRELDLGTGIVRTSYQVGYNVYEREVFASAPDQAIVVRLRSHRPGAPDEPAPMHATLSFQSPQMTSVEVKNGNQLILRGRNTGSSGIDGALTFEARAAVIAEDGSVRADEHQLHLDGVSSATIVIVAATSFRRYDDVSGDPAANNTATLRALEGKSYDALRAAHLADYGALFGRVSLDLGRNPEAEALPTDARLRQDASVSDPSLAALYFQYGRYLLISSSRPGTQPANLQGIWNNSLFPPWESKYTLNINAEMNYWPAEVTHLPELAEPLFAMVRDLSETGGRIAREHYGADGWVTHHNTDLWRAAAPIDGAFWGMWPTGGAWLSLHLWEHFRYSRDEDFLAGAYPLLRGAAAFFLDTLVEHPEQDWLVTSPSNSPENAHHPGVSIAMGPAMDNQILRDLFGATITAAHLLGRDEAFAADLAAARDRLPPDQIGAQGQLQEWLEDWDAQAPEPDHRHVSHLYALHPSNQITPRGTPALAAAA
ncbi:MAG: glycosyl hydrolase family 95 catalytic domain-containing protein, partial [Opitutales bacterium]